MWKCEKCGNVKMKKHQIIYETAATKGISFYI